MQNELQLTPTDFITIANQTLEYTYSSITIIGEVASFKINQGKWVFFDIKDEESSISCFMTLYQLRTPLEDGMKVTVRGTPKITKWGKFSFTVNSVRPAGEGSIKKAYEILKKKLSGEGLFDPAKKRQLPKYPARIGVISSTGAAGYADFIKILNARWGGINVQVAHTQVQGMDAPDQIIRALSYFNEHSNVEVVAILRGGGSADDLSCFNDEALARAIAASKIPTITGIGHEVDESLADLAADVRASTPSNAAEILTPDKKGIRANITSSIKRLSDIVSSRIETEKNSKIEKTTQIANIINIDISNYRKNLFSQIKILSALDPEKILKQGYAILSGKISPGNVVKITTFNKEIKAEIKEINGRS